MRRAIAALLLTVVGIAGTAHAASPTATQREVGRLFTALETSGCSFNRNGTWYAAVDARKHLQRKYDYLRKRDAVTSTERFIELAGTRSSMSGRTYQVRCPGRTTVESGPWFREVLAKLRADG